MGLIKEYFDEFAEDNRGFLSKTVDDIVDFLILDYSKPNGNVKNALINYDCIPKGMSINWNGNKEEKERAVEKQQIYQRKLLEKLRNVDEPTCVEYCNRMISMIRKKNFSYYKKRSEVLDVEKAEYYDEADLEKIGNILSLYKSKEGFIRASTVLILLVLNHTFENWMSLGATYFLDQEEFFRDVIQMYGLTKEAETKIKELSSRKYLDEDGRVIREGNSIALNTLGDIEYYDVRNKNEKERDFNKAYELYMKAAGLSDSNKESIRPLDPLAVYNLAYIYFNYHQKRKGNNELLKCCEIEGIENIKGYKKEGTFDTSVLISKAIDTLNFAIDYIPNGPMINLMGKIAFATENGVEHNIHTRADILRKTSKMVINEEKKRGTISDAEVFFLRAIEKYKFVFAFNNMAIVNARKACSIYHDKDKNKKERAQPFVDKYIDYLTLSANNGEVWAANQLGLFYSTGKINNYDTDFNPSGDVCETGELDSRKAIECFEKVIRIADKRNTTRGWAAFNLLVMHHSSLKLKRNIEIYERIVEESGDDTCKRRLKEWLANNN